MRKLLIAGLLALAAWPAGAAVDKGLMERDSSAWFKASAETKDYTTMAAISYFIARGVWVAPGKGVQAMKGYKAKLAACVGKGATEAKKQHVKMTVGEVVFYCALSYQWIQKEQDQ